MTFGTMRTKLFSNFISTNAMGMPESAVLTKMAIKPTILRVFSFNGGG
jgi:hypothetical protein